MRETENSLTLRKSWAVLLSQGDIDVDAGFTGRIVRPGDAIRLAYVQDLDGDLMPAGLEYMLGTVDSATDVYNNATWTDLAIDSLGNPIPQPDGIPDSIDTVHDGLPDRVEALIGWTVDLGGKGSRRVTSSGYLKDSDFDGVPDGVEAPDLTAFEDLNNDGRLDRFNPNLVNPDDFVTDPTNPDTDGDNVARWIYRDPADNTAGLSDDYVEIYGDGVATGTTPPDNLISGVHVGGLYRVKRIYAGGGIFNTRTSPTLLDTDGDGINDGGEVRFGLNPYQAGDKDSDRDGLPDIVETTPRVITYRTTSMNPRQEGTLVTINNVTSDPFNPDTDGDGLSDFVEFDLSNGNAALPVQTNPRSADTDGDGLTDKQEFLGITVRDLGVISLNPLDADTDNDMRSDGDEAELVDIESKRWFVVTEGKAPYRVYSDPRFADSDYDGLVDGEEYGGTYRTDPNLADTDGDGRNDGEEVHNGDNPLSISLQQSVHVTIVAEYVVFTADGNNGGGGYSEVTVRVRRPDAAGVGGLSNCTTQILFQANNYDDQGPNSGNNDRYDFADGPFNGPGPFRIPLSQRS